LTAARAGSGQPYESVAFEPAVKKRLLSGGDRKIPWSGVSELESVWGGEVKYVDACKNMDKEGNSTRYDMEFKCKSSIDKNDQQECNANK
jgi:hypothetical protein